MELYTRRDSNCLSAAKTCICGLGPNEKSKKEAGLPHNFIDEINNSAINLLILNNTPQSKRYVEGNLNKIISGKGLAPGELRQGAFDDASIWKKIRLLERDGYPSDHRIGGFQGENEIIHKKFNELSAKWKDEVRFISSSDEIANNKNYLKIIEIGPEVLPFIFNELSSKPGHWFHALNAITGENPVKPEHRGNLKLMTRDWLAWAKKHGYG